MKKIVFLLLLFIASNSYADELCSLKIDLKQNGKSLATIPHIMVTNPRLILMEDNIKNPLIIRNIEKTSYRIKYKTSYGSTMEKRVSIKTEFDSIQLNFDAYNSDSRGLLMNQFEDSTILKIYVKTINCVGNENKPNPLYIGKENDTFYMWGMCDKRPLTDKEIEAIKIFENRVYNIPEGHGCTASIMYILELEGKTIRRHIKKYDGMCQFTGWSSLMVDLGFDR